MWHAAPALYERLRDEFRPARDALRDDGLDALMRALAPADAAADAADAAALRDARAAAAAAATASEADEDGAAAAAADAARAARARRRRRRRLAEAPPPVAQPEPWRDAALVRSAIRAADQRRVLSSGTEGDRL